ncbi:cell cycle control protein 50C-like isoform X5 [Equus przewalskii]
MKRTPQDCPSRLPENTAVKQQQLPACRLQLSATGILSGFFATGVFCLGMGVILILSAKSSMEIEINYTKICASCAKLRENARNFDKECTCSIPFHLTQTMRVLAHSYLSKACTGHPMSCYNLSAHPPCTPDPGDLLEFQFFHGTYHLLMYYGNVYMYYKLYGFYQNLHGYLLSRSNSQLLGTDVKDVETCAPFSKSHDGTPIAPCGAIANSLFNGTTKPPSWPKPVYELDENDPGNNGFLNDDFIVWMRTAAFPTFKKLYRRLSRTQHFIEGLPAGNYSFNVSYNFPVTRFQGEKSVVLSTLTWSGGHSLFLGLAYTVTGAMTWLAAFSMMAVHLKLKGKRFSPDDKVKL